MITLVFGCFKDKWVWRVEYLSGKVLKHRDFVQTEPKLGQAREDALAFKVSLLSQAA